MKFLGPVLVAVGVVVLFAILAENV